MYIQITSMSTINERKSLQFIAESEYKHMLFADGASNNKYKKSGIGIAVFKDRELVDYIADEIFKKDTIHTNNESEYLAAIRSLQYCKENNLQNAIIYADSKLVVNQINGEWAIKSEHLYPLYLQARQLFTEQDVKIKHVRREYNYFADFYSKYAIEQFKSQSIEKFKKKYYIREP